MFKEIKVVPRGESTFTTWEQRLDKVKENKPELLSRGPHTPGWIEQPVDSSLLRKYPDLPQELRELGTLVTSQPAPSFLQRIKSILRGVRFLHSRRFI